MCYSRAVGGSLWSTVHTQAMGLHTWVCTLGVCIRANSLETAEKSILKALGITGMCWNVYCIVGARKCATLVQLGVAYGQHYTSRPWGAAHLGVYLEG